MKIRLFLLLFSAALLVSGLAGCGGGDNESAETATDGTTDGTSDQAIDRMIDVAAETQGRAPTPSTNGDNGLQALAGSVEYHSPEGGFYVIWPPGCAGIRLRTWRLNGADDSDDPANVGRANIFCDRAGREAEGCAVNVHFLSRMEDRPEATPERVIDAVKTVMTSFQLDILRQSPIRRGELEGIGLHCLPVAEEDDGAVWIEGFAYGGNIYVLTAWSASRTVFDQPEFQTFFASFLPDGAGYSAVGASQ